MQLEVGNIVEGKVTGITKFGAFVELPGGKTGMVHISEVASSYVKEIRDHLSENDVVKVKILGITDEGKVSLSIKQAMPQGPAPSRRPASSSDGYTPRRSNKPDGWRSPQQSGQQHEMSFEDMLSKFKQSSDDKMSDLKKYMDMRKGSSRRGSR